MIVMMALLESRPNNEHGDLACYRFKESELSGPVLLNQLEEMLQSGTDIEALARATARNLAGKLSASAQVFICLWKVEQKQHRCIGVPSDAIWERDFSSIGSSTALAQTKKKQIGQRKVVTLDLRGSKSVKDNQLVDVQTLPLYPLASTRIEDYAGCIYVQTSRNTQFEAIELKVCRHDMEAIALAALHFSAILQAQAASTQEITKVAQLLNDMRADVADYGSLSKAAENGGRMQTHFGSKSYVISNALRHYFGLQLPENHLEKIDLIKVAQLIKRHGLKGATGELNIGESTLRRIIKEKTGLSFKDWTTSQGLNWNTEVQRRD